MPSYEPIYLSKQHKWKNVINFSEDERRKHDDDLFRVKNNLMMIEDECRRENIDKFVYRQAIIDWVYRTTFYDEELHDFDKKVGIDTRALIVENISTNEDKNE